MKPVEVREPELPPVSPDCALICLQRVFARMLALTKQGVAAGWQLNDALAKTREEMAKQKPLWN